MRARLVTVVLWLAAGAGLHAWSVRLRAERGETAVARLRAFPFGAGRHTRLDALLGRLQRTRGPAHFVAEAPVYVFGPVRVEVRFGDAEPATFEVDSSEVVPLDAGGAALAEVLRQVPPPAGAGAPGVK